jgi:VWFA-related protein
MLSLLTAGAMLAQAPQGDVPTFKASSNLVIVTVFVRGKDGKPKKGLKKEDFVVTENGKAQALSVFEFQELEAAAAAASVAVETAEKPAEPQGRARFRDKRLMVLFFDWSSLPEADQVRAKDAAEEYLNKNMAPSDLVEVVTFGSRLKVEQEFTSDKTLLLDLIKKFQTGQMSDLATEGATGVENTDDSSFTPDDAEFNLFNTDRKLVALEDLARQLTAMPEKKAVIYFSSGVGKTGDDNQAQLRATVNAAVRGNVSFYPIDVRGLQADPPGGGASSSGGGRGTGLYSGSTQRGQRQASMDSQDTLFALASDTGGKALIDNNELVMGIKQAQEDLQSYYILGFYSSDEKKDGAFRRVDVKLTAEAQGRLQAKLDFRRGYFAEKEFKAFGSYDKERQLEDALMLGDPVTELRLALEVNWFRVGKDRYFVPVAVKIPGSAIPLKKQGSAETTTFDFIGQVRDTKGALMGAVRDSIKIQLRDDKTGQLASRSLMYDTGFTLVPGKYQIKMLVRENQTGKMGTFESKFQVPDLGGLKDGLRLSSVVWSGQRTQVADAVGLADKKLKKQDKHPLVRDKEKLLPSVTHVFRPGQTMFVYAELYDPAMVETRNVPAVSAAVTVYRDKKLVLESAPVTVAALKEGRSGTAGLYLEVPLKDLKPGEYTTQLSVIDQAGQKFGFARAPLIVMAR